MGDRAQVHVVAGKDKPYACDVWLYTHWHGTELPETVAMALGRGERWRDPGYLARIIFSEMISRHDEVQQETGYGIDSHQHGDVSRVITVDVDEQIVTVDGWTEMGKQRMGFKEYTQSPAVGWAL